jgi:hypothetical protein
MSVPPPPFSVARVGCVEDLAIVYAVTSHFLDSAWAERQRVPPTWTLPPQLTLPPLTRNAGPGDLQGLRLGLYREVRSLAYTQ